MLLDIAVSRKGKVNLNQSQHDTVIVKKLGIEDHPLLS